MSIALLAWAASAVTGQYQYLSSPHHQELRQSRFAPDEKTLMFPNSRGVQRLKQSLPERLARIGANAAVAEGSDEG